MNSENAVLNRNGWVQHLPFIAVLFIISFELIRIIMGAVIIYLRSDYWFSRTSVNRQKRETKKVSVPFFSAVEKVLVYWCCCGIFCRIRGRFCIIRFINFQKSKHEKRLETNVSSLRNPVIMRGIKLRLTFGDRCSTNWAIPLNKKCCVVSLAHLQEIWYHKHAVLSSVFQHKNANLNKHTVLRVRDARQLYFIIRDIACRIACLRTWMTCFLTTAQLCYRTWKGHVIFRRLRCDWIFLSKNVYLKGAGGDYVSGGRYGKFLFASQFFQLFSYDRQGYISNFYWNFYNPLMRKILSDTASTRYTEETKHHEEVSRVNNGKLYLLWKAYWKRVRARRELHSSQGSAAAGVLYRSQPLQQEGR